MKKSTAWIFWGISSVVAIFSLVKMFLGTTNWVPYAVALLISFYFTRKIFKDYLLR